MSRRGVAALVAVLWVLIMLALTNVLGLQVWG